MPVQIALRSLASLFAILVFRTTAVAAQPALVRVTDSSSMPVPFAVVHVGSGNARIADSAGVLRVADATGDTLSLRVRRIGFLPFAGRVARAPGGEFVVTLARAAQLVEGVRVVASPNTPIARRGFYDRVNRVQHGAIVGEFFTPEDLETQKPMSVSQILQRSRYARVHREGPQRRASIVGTRGSCAMTILIDGVRVNNLLEAGDERERERMSSLRGSTGGSKAEVRSSIDEIVDGSGVAAVEVYPSTANAPAELIPLTGGGSCGLIAIWTGGRT